MKRLLLSDVSPRMFGYDTDRRVHSCAMPHDLLSLTCEYRPMTIHRIALLCGVVLIPRLSADESVFSKQIAPVLEQKCLRCHNSTDRKGDFSLESVAELRESGVVEPGNSASSRLMQVISPDGTMPPSMPPDGAQVTESERNQIETWIANGAATPAELQLKPPVVSDYDWWSLRPLRVVTVPEPPDSEAWIQSPIDAFILRRLQEAGLQPSPRADRRTLIRRLSFDLLGLPPDTNDVEAFVNDRDPQAWAKLVDRWLDSPQYGERWARHWLDVAHYADTCGYDKDKLRPNAWPYRDYVIRSFNDDKPYARFIEEQIAGDILFPGDADGILGLGFIAAGPWDFIGHVEVPESKIDGKVARNLDRDDMVSSTLNTFCSLTIQCARCHNHKFDPMTQQHYYALQSVFAAVDRAERPYDTDPQVEQNRLLLEQQRDDAARKLTVLESDVRNEGGDLFSTLEKQVAKLRPLAGVNGLKPEYGYHSQIEKQADQQKWIIVDLGESTPIQRIDLHPCYDDYADIGAGFGFPVRFRVETANDPDDFQVVLDQTQQDFPNPGLNTVSVNLEQTVRLIRVTAVKLASRSGDFNFALSEVRAITAEDQNAAAGCQVTALDSIEAPVRWRKTNLTDGIWPAPADPEATRKLLDAEKQLAALRNRLWTAERNEKKQMLQARQKEAADALAALPQGRMVYAAATQFQPQGNFKPTAGVPRSVHVLHRGNETQPRELSLPGTVPLTANDQWLFQLPEDHSEADRRAALAKWIVREDHPLTWRSIVNRIWQYHFGQAIVDSPNDFGRMGQLPSHPELLDWLAAEFLRSGGSMKAMHRLILNSSTWMQSSSIHEQAAELDQQNRLLARMTRRKLSAEELRDAMLAVSGCLNYEMGGPGFYLFELEKTAHSPHYEYFKFDPSDPKSHRRSIYRFIVRSQPDPFMTTLDCADSSQSTPRRHETLTALQALSLLNNPFCLTMSQQFADRLKSEHDTMTEQIEAGFSLSASRPPSVIEQRVLSEYASKHGLPALTRILLNMNEFVFVD